MDKKVFVIIVTYNGEKWIDKCLTSLQQSSYPVQAIVLDNNSDDSTVNIVNKYPEVRLIETGSNLGFGKANNMGMAEALKQGGDYVFLLNQDAYVFKHTIGSLVSKAVQIPEAGIISPMHFASDEINLDTAFATYLKRAKGKQGNNLIELPFVNAAAWLISRKCLEKVGFFEPLFSHYGEDRNYCDRVLYHNFLILADEEAKIVHDRVITRNFKKDIIQSKYKILATLINPGYSYGKAYAKALKEVLGLPKYFSRFYGPGKAFVMLVHLKFFYVYYIFNTKPIIEARKRAM